MIQLTLWTSTKRVFINSSLTQSTINVWGRYQIICYQSCTSPILVSTNIFFHALLHTSFCLNGDYNNLRVSNRIEWHLIKNSLHVKKNGCKWIKKTQRENQLNNKIYYWLLSKKVPIFFFLFLYGSGLRKASASTTV